MSAGIKLFTAIFPSGCDGSTILPRRSSSLRFPSPWKALLCLLFAIGTQSLLPAVQTLTFNGVSTVLSTGTVTLSAPVGIAVDPSFNVYVADTDTTAGVGRITKIAQNGTSSQLTINGLTLSTAPKQIAIDGSGNLYIADSGNSRIVEVNPSTGNASVLSTGSITLSVPQGVVIDAAGDIFIADTGNNRIVEVPASGSATVYAITGLTVPTTLRAPEGLAIDGWGQLYIADAGNGRIVKVTPGGVGTGTGETLPITGTAPITPVSVAMDSFGTLYVADSGSNRIVAVSTALAGTDFSSAHRLTNSQPAGVAVDIYGNVYVADTGNSAVDLVQINAIGFGHNKLGQHTAQDFSLVIGQTTGPDLTNLTIPAFGRTGLDFTSGGTTTCSSGTGNPSTCIIGVEYFPTVPGYRQGAMILTYIDNSATPQVTRSLTVPLYAFNDAPQAALYPGLTSVLGTGSVATQTPYQIAVDGSGTVYVGNATSNNVVQIPAYGSASVLSTGHFILGHVNGVAIDGAGNRFIADNQNNLIYEVSATNVVYQLSINVGGWPVSLSGPTALAVDGGGNLFIADSGNGRILKVALQDPTLATTFPLNAIVMNTGSYTFNSGITGLAVDSMQNLYVVDNANSRIVKITAAGALSIVSFPGFTLSNPEGVALDGMGNLYVTDAGNNRVLQLTTAGVVSAIQLQGLTNPATLGGGPGNHLYGVAVDASGNIYIADSTNNRVVKVSVSQASLSFASTKQGQTSTDSPQTATVLNLGDEALTFSADPTYPASFIADTGDTNPCTVTTSLSGGTSCNISVKFVPQTIGSFSQSITISDNSLNATNGSMQSVVAKGTGLVPADTTAIAVSATPSPATNGQGVTITATVTDAISGNTAMVPIGSVAFSDLVGSTATSLNNGSTVVLSGGVATLSGVVLNGIGTHTITASYGGVSELFATSSNTTTVVVNKAAIVTPTAPSTQQLTTGQAGSVTVTVSGPYTTIPAPSGTITYSLVNASGVSVATGTASLTAGSTSSTATIPLANTLASGSYTLTVTAYSGDSNYAASSTTVNLTSISVSQITPTLGWTLSSSSIPYGATLNGILNAVAMNGSSTVAGSFVYMATPSGGSATTVTGATALAAGSYTLSAAFTPTDSTTYSSANITASLTVNKATPAVTLVSSVNPVLATNAVTFTATVSSTAGTPTGSVNFYDGTTLLGSATLSSGTAVYTTASLAVATHQITAVYNGDSNFVSVTSSAVALAVDKITPTISLASSVNPVLVGTPVTFTATVSSTKETPAGAVSFYDGTTLLGSVTSSSGTAVYTTASLAAATHQITAVYNGDSNFASVASLAVAELVQDYSLGTSSSSGNSGSSSGSSSSQTVAPGGTATYTLAIGPLNGTTLPSAVTLSVSGLPPDATATITPQVLPAGSALTNVTLTIKTSKQLAPVLFGLLLLPFGSVLRGSRKRLGRTICVLLLTFAGLGLVAGLTGCGAHQQKDYAITVTATSGAVSHSTTVNLTVR